MTSGENQHAQGIKQIDQVQPARCEAQIDMKTRGWYMAAETSRKASRPETQTDTEHHSRNMAADSFQGTHPRHRRVRKRETVAGTWLSKDIEA